MSSQSTLTPSLLPEIEPPSSTNPTTEGSNWYGSDWYGSDWYGADFYGPAEDGGTPLLDAAEAAYGAVTTPAGMLADLLGAAADADDSLDVTKAGDALTKVLDVLAPLDAVLGAAEFYGGVVDGDLGEMVSGAAGVFTGGVGTAGLLGASLPVLGPAAAVVGTATGGFTIGQWIDDGVDLVGDWITGDPKGDHSVSGGLSDLLTPIYSIFEEGAE